MNTVNDTLDPLARRALRVIYGLSYEGRAVNARRLAVALGISRDRAEHTLRALDAAGFLWAERGRLTLAGLALAVRLSCRAGRSASRAA